MGISFEKSRTICCSDATGSMSGLWGATKEYIQVMFERMKSMVDEEYFEMMWIAYHDYDVSPVIEKSSWSNNVSILQNFVNGIELDGGGV